MNVLPNQCPICGGEVVVTRFQCDRCDVTIEGRFTVGKFARLSDEQVQFVETFVRCEGKINKVEEELGLSYPTVRNRLNEVIRALGYEVPEEQGLAAEQRKIILEKLAAGEITSEEAIKLLRGKGS